MPFIQMKDGSRALSGDVQRRRVLHVRSRRRRGDLGEHAKGKKTQNGFEVPKRKGVSYTFTKAKTILIEMEGGPLRYVEGALHASHGTQVYKCIHGLCFGDEIHRQIHARWRHPSDNDSRTPYCRVSLDQASVFHPTDECAKCHLSSDGRLRCSSIKSSALLCNYLNNLPSLEHIST